jgi:ABC-type uncharacterized transport system permease subunit
MEEQTRAAKEELGHAREDLAGEAEAHTEARSQLERQARTIRRYKRTAGSLALMSLVGGAVFAASYFGPFPLAVDITVAVLVGISSLIQSYRYVRNLDLDVVTLLHEVWLAAAGIGAPFVIAYLAKQ